MLTYVTALVCGPILELRKRSSSSALGSATVSGMLPPTYITSLLDRRCCEDM